MLDYINEEEAILSNILATYELRENDELKPIRNLLILATGSSYNACLAAKTIMEKIANLSITIEEPYYFNHYGKLSDSIDAVLAVSQSGKSSSTIDAMKQIKEKNIFTLALTSDSKSPISQAVEYVIAIDIGIEKVGFVTKGYVATILQLILFSMSLGKSNGEATIEMTNYYKDELNKVIKKIPEIIKKTLLFFEQHESVLKIANRYIAIGYGPNWGTAKEFETKFTETVRKPSQGFELESYMHGPYLEANYEHILFFIETPSHNLERSTKLRDYMKPYVGETLIITTENKEAENSLSLAFECDEFISPLALVIPFQILAYKIATSKGIDLNQKIFDDFDQVLKSKRYTEEEIVGC